MILKAVKNPVHKHQEKDYSCGAASFSIIFGLKENDAINIVNCKEFGKERGTKGGDIKSALDRREIESYLCSINQDFNDYSDFLKYNSLKYPIWVGGVYHDRFNKTGRDRLRKHAVAVIDGIIYDPAENRECPIESYSHTFNKKLFIDDIVIICQERPDFIRNFIDEYSQT